MKKANEQDRKKVMATALTATAAGAGLLGGATAEAAIVYSGPVNQTIDFLPDNSNSTQGFGIDFDTMTVTNLVGASGVNSINSPPAGTDLRIVKSHPNSMKVITSAGGKVAAGALGFGVDKLAADVSVGSTTGFSSGTSAYMTYSLIADGALFPIYATQWDAGATGEFVGFQFKNGADTHYGWVRLNLVQVQGEPGQWLGNSTDSFTIVDFAYESTPNLPILTGDTTVVPEPGAASLGLLALGAIGVRRRSKVA